MSNPPDSPARIAVVADIHGNADALSAVLADIGRHGADMVVNLGDHLSGPLAAAETADMVMAHEMVSIRGNHDRWLVEQDAAEMGPSDRAAFDQLGSRHLDWLRALPPTARIGDVFACHATPGDDLTYWLEEVGADGRVAMRSHEGIAELADGVEAGLILCAHTHIPRMVRLGNGRVILNPGSVGLPAYDDDRPVPHVMQTGTPAARWALAERGGSGWAVSFRQVPYDTARMAGLARAAGREDWARAVATGWL